MIKKLTNRDLPTRFWESAFIGDELREIADKYGIKKGKLNRDLASNIHWGRPANKEDKRVVFDITLSMGNVRLPVGTRSKCSACKQPIRLILDAETESEVWVHEDPDEDPKSRDYGWVQCSGGQGVASP